MPEENPIEKIEDEIKSEPWYVWAGAAAAAGIVVYFLWKQRHASASTTASTSANSSDATNGISQGDIASLPFGDLSGYDLASGPVANYPNTGYQEIGVNGNQVPVVPFGDTPIFDNNGNLIGWQGANPNPTPTPTSPNPTPPPTTTPPPSNPPPSLSWPELIVRGKSSSGPNASYDAHNSGIPLRAGPADNGVLTFVPFGAEIQSTGTEVTGGYNNKTGKNGSYQWYPVTYNGTKGYVSAWDIGNVLPVGGPMRPIAVTGVGGGGYHLPINKGRNTVDQWTFANGMHQDFDSHVLGE